MEREAIQAEINRREREDCIVGMWNRSKVPALHRDKARTYANVAPTSESESRWRATLDKVTARLGSGFIIVLHGSRGPGKTQLAVNVIRESCIQLRPAHYTTALAMFLEMREANHDDGSEKRVVNRYTGSPDEHWSADGYNLLVIDECHERGETAWENRILSHIIDARYGAKLDTILITNEAIGTACSTLGPSIIDRIRECGAFVSCDWGSFRMASQ